MPKNHIVHVVDENQRVCQALGLILARAGYTCRLHSSAVAFLEAPPEDQAGCVVTAVRMPGMDGFEFQQRLKTLGVSLPVIMLTGHADVAMAVSALKAGAFDFIEKSIDTSKLLAAVAAALEYRGRSVRRVAGIEKIQGCLSTLSTREHEVLDGLLAGWPNKAIARDLGVSPRTIEVYRAKLMLKMQAQSLSGLLRMALTVGSE